MICDHKSTNPSGEETYNGAQFAAYRETQPDIGSKGYLWGMKGWLK